MTAKRDTPSRPESCPQCRSKEIAPIIYGLPGSELRESAQHGEVILGGCTIFEDNPLWHCKKCEHEWK